MRTNKIETITSSTRRVNFDSLDSVLFYSVYVSFFYSVDSLLSFVILLNVIIIMISFGSLLFWMHSFYWWPSIARAAHINIFCFYLFLLSRRHLILSLNCHSCFYLFWYVAVAVAVVATVIYLFICLLAVLLIFP